MSAFHCVTVVGLAWSYHVDAEARREVELWLRDADGPPTLDVMTIYGEDVTLVRGFVASLHSTSPLTRKLDRELAKAINDEIPIEERG